MGSRTYYFPHSDVEVQVDYDFTQEDGAVFDAAYIDGAEINCNKICVIIPEHPRIDSLAVYFQGKLDEDESEIEQEEADGIAEARADEREGR